ncbi:long-chain fatty acid--CoA ligase, partial [Mycobacterium sp. ITM-2017-0098]
MGDLTEPRFLDERVAHWATATPDAEAMDYLDRSWTWSQWNDRVRRLAGALTERGITRGDVVAFLDKNHPACVELTFAAASLGAANAIINFRLAADELDYVLNDSGAKLLIVGAEFASSIEKIRDRLSHVEHVITVKPEGDDEYEAMLEAASPVERSDDVEPGDVAIIMYSSGTTGRPKGVELTQANLIAHTINAHEGFEFDEGDKNMVAMPLFHVGGSSYVQFGIHDGVPSVMTRDVDGMTLAGAILKGANRTFLVPAVLAKVLESGEDAVKLFSALKTFAYGASPMPLPLLRAALKAWPDTDFMQAYGLTEVCGVISHLLPEA